METNVVIALFVGIVFAVFISTATMFFVFRERYRKLASQIDRQLDSKSDLPRLRAEYLEYLLRTYRGFKFRGPGEPSKIPTSVSLDNIYVPLLAQLDSSSLEEGKQVLVENEVFNHQKVIILGNPGSGKTTTLLHIATDLAQKKETFLPIYIPLRSYANVLAISDIGLQEYLHEFYEYSHPIAVAPLFESVIAEGKALILLDGLDEVGRIRPELIRKIELFADSVVPRGNKIVVTSRIVGYQEFPLDHSWTLLTLLDWGEDAIEKYIRNWYLVLEMGRGSTSSENVVEAERKSESLIEAIRSNSRLRVIATSPLMLAILISLHSQRGLLPDSRVKLYDMVLEILVDKWNYYRSPDLLSADTTFDYYVAVDVLSSLALWTRQQNNISGVVKKDELIEWLTNYFMGDEWKKPRGEAIKSATEFLYQIQNSGLFLERGYNMFGFVHRTFEDVLAARGIAKLQIEERDLIVRTYISDEAWDEPIVLAVGVLGILQARRLEANAMVGQLLDLGQPGIKVATKCLEEYGTSNILDKELIQRIKKNGAKA